MSESESENEFLGFESKKAYKMAINLPLPQAINIHSSDIVENISLFSDAWENYEIASGLDEKSDKIRIATLLTAIGNDCYKVFKNLPLSEDQKSTAKNILKALKEHLTPQVNIIYERYVFNTTCQTDMESADQFIHKLRARIKTCQYGALEDDLLRDRIVVGVRDVQVRKRLLTQANLTLAESISACRISEVTEMQFKSMNINQEINEEVSKIYAKPSTSSNRAKQCKFCGTNHEWKKELCPAAGKSCSVCNKQDHFAKMCYYKKKLNKRHVKAIQDTDNNANEDNYSEVNIVETCEEEYIFTIKNMDDVKVLTTELTMICGIKQKKYAIRCQLDTGATVNVMGLENYCEIIKESSPKILPSTIKLKCFGGMIMKPLGQVVLKCIHNQKSYNLVFQIVSQNSIPMLSANTSIRLGLIQTCFGLAKNTDQHYEEAKTILKKFPEVFGGLGKLRSIVHLEIDEAVVPTVQAPRRIPIALRQELQNRLQEMVNQKIIIKEERHTDWVSNILLVKRNNKLRICLDPIALNKALKRPHYQVPTIDEILPELSKARVFSTLDAEKGFWQLELDQESSELTTFWTPFGRYRWLRMPFGISPASEIYQMHQHEILNGLKGVETIADDILVYGVGDTYEEALADHNRNLEALLTRLKSANLKLNKEKVKLCQKEVLFYGHILTNHGVKADPAKVSAINQTKTPTNPQELQRFLGMTTYLAKYIPHLSAEATNLRELLKRSESQDKKWCWESSHQNTFETLKKLVTEAPVLAYYDTNRPITIQCDASSMGLGAVLLQENRPVAFASRTLSSAEKNYVQMEKEALSILFGCRRFDQYVNGRSNITVQTDHLPLITIFKKPLVDAPKRLQRIMMGLQRYGLKVVYVKGKEMYIADFLSRAPEPNVDEMRFDSVYHFCEDSKIYNEIANINTIKDLRISDQRIQIIRQETISDKHMQLLANVIQKGWPNSVEQVDESLRMYWKYKEEMNTQQGLILKGDRIVIPSALRSDFLKRLHLSHSGIEASLKLARDTVFWPGITNHIKDCVGACETCKENSAAPTKEPMQTHEIPQLPFQRVGMDIMQITPTEKYLITVDHFSDFFELDYIKDMNSKTIIEICKTNFSRHGTPEVVVTDNGTSFVSMEFRSFASSWEFRHTTSSPHHQQGNGKSEAAVKIAKSIIHKSKRDGSDVWKALQLWRNTPNKVNTSPVQRIFSRRTRCNIPLTTLKLQPKVIEDVPMQIAQNRREAKYYYDRTASKRELPDLQVGQDVYIQTKPQSNATWTKGKLISNINSRSCIVDIDGVEYRRNREHAKEFKSNQNSENEISSSSSQDVLEEPRTIIQNEDPMKDVAPGTANSRPKRTTRQPLRYQD